MNIVEKTYERRPKTLKRNLIVGISIAIAILWSLDVMILTSAPISGNQIALSILAAMFNPSELLFSLDIDGIPFLMFETLGIAFLGTILGAILSLPFAFLSSRNIVGNKPSIIGNTIISIIRTFPFFILALMFIRVTGPGPLTGVLTIGVMSIGMMSKLYVEIIEDIDKGILEALDATGATVFQKIRYGIIPQLFASLMSIVLHRFEINVKNATVLGIVGAGGIGFTLLTAMGSFRWNDAAAALIGIMVVVLGVEYLSTTIRNRIMNG